MKTTAKNMMNIIRLALPVALCTYLFSLSSTVSAQTQLSYAYGTYAGMMSTKVYNEENPGGIELTSKKLSIVLSEEAHNTLTLKAYPLSKNIVLKDITFADIIITNRGESLHICAPNNVSGQFPTTDDKYAVSLDFSIPDMPSNTITPAGTIEITFKVRYEGRLLEHVFKGKKTDQEPKAIEKITQSSSSPTIYHDMQGRRVEKPMRGLYIANGRKIVF